MTLFFWSVKGLCWCYAMLVCAFNSLRNSECSRFFIVTAFSNSPFTVKNSFILTIKKKKWIGWKSKTWKSRKSRKYFSEFLILHYSKNWKLGFKKLKKNIRDFRDFRDFAFDVLLDMRFTHVCKQKLNFFILHYIWNIFPTKSNYFNSNDRTIYLFTYKCSRRQDTGGDKMVLRVMKLIY